MSKQVFALRPLSSRRVRARGLDNLYTPTSRLAICFSVLDDSDLSADTCFKHGAMHLPSAAFFSQCTLITPSTYVWTSFVSDLVLVKSIVICKTSRQTWLFDHLLYWLCVAWAHCHHYETESTLHTNRVHHFCLWCSNGTRPSPEFSPRLLDKICGRPGNEPKILQLTNQRW